MCCARVKTDHKAGKDGAFTAGSSGTVVGLGQNEGFFRFREMSSVLGSCVLTSDVLQIGIFVFLKRETRFPKPIPPVFPVETLSEKELESIPIMKRYRKKNPTKIIPKSKTLKTTLLTC